MDLITSRGPLIQTRRKSLWHPSAVADSIVWAHQMVRGIEHVVAVQHEGEVIGLARGRADDKYVVDHMPLSHKRWCGFDTYQQMIQAYASGRYAQTYFRKLPSSFTTANRWADLWPVGGTPEAGDYSGTADTARSFTNATTGALRGLGCAVDAQSMTKHIVGWDAGVESGSATTNLCGWLYDRVIAYDGCIISNGSRTMTNSVTATRYITTDVDPGLMIMPTVTTAGALGATASNLIAMDVVYNNGASGSIDLNVTLPWQASAPAAAADLPASVCCPHITGSNETMCPFLPLSSPSAGAPALGVQQVDNYASSANNTGTVSIVLAKPLMPFFGRAQGPRQKVDLSHTSLTLERIYDDACICVVMGRVVTTATVWSMILKVAWS